MVSRLLFAFIKSSLFIGLLILGQLTFAAESANIEVDSIVSVPETKVHNLQKVTYCNWPKNPVLIKRAANVNYYWKREHYCGESDTAAKIARFAKAQAQFESEIVPRLQSRSLDLSKSLPYWDKAIKEAKVLDIVISDSGNGNASEPGPLVVSALNGKNYRLKKRANLEVGFDSDDLFSTTFHEVGHVYAGLLNPVFKDESSSASCLHPLTEAIADFYLLSAVDFNPQAYDKLNLQDSKKPQGEERPALEGNLIWLNARQFSLPLTASHRSLPEVYYNPSETHSTAHIFSYLSYRLSTIVPHDLLTKSFFDMIKEDGPSIRDPNLTRFADEWTKKIQKHRPDLEPNVQKILTETKWNKVENIKTGPIVKPMKSLNGKYRIDVNGLSATSTVSPKLSIKNNVSSSLNHNGSAKGWACERYLGLDDSYLPSYFELAPVSNCNQLNERASCSCVSKDSKSSLTIRAVFLNKDREIAESAQEIQLPNEFKGRCFRVTSQIDTERVEQVPHGPTIDETGTAKPTR